MISAIEFTCNRSNHHLYSMCNILFNQSKLLSSLSASKSLHTSSNLNWKMPKLPWKKSETKSLTKPFVKKEKKESQLFKNFIDVEEAKKQYPSPETMKKFDLPPKTPSKYDIIKRDVTHVFYNRYRYGGYEPIDDDDIPKLIWKDVREKGIKSFMKENLADVKANLVQWKDETEYHMRFKHLDDMVPMGEVMKVYELNKDTVKNWGCSSDGYFGEGYSTATITCSPNNKGLFSGVLSTRVPQDGRTTYAGYCQIKSPMKYRAFYIQEKMDWRMFDCIVLRVRGDGRMYKFHLHVPGFFDMTWLDVYTYVFHTRGGPYWQEITIPFSKFIFQNRGTVQDIQHSFNNAPFDVETVGISISDTFDGPFQLEIDYIGVKKDLLLHPEHHAYESYFLPPMYAKY